MPLACASSAAPSAWLLLQAPAGSEQPNMLMMLAVVGLIFFFVAILPERKARKRKQAMLEAMKKNDRVLINPGLYATIAAVGEQDVTIKFDDGPTRVKVLKSAIASVLDKDEGEPKAS